MSEWKKVRLGEIANYVNEKIDIKAFDTSLYISTDSMLKDKGGIGTPESIPESGKVTKYQHNDILVSNIRPYFKKIWFSNREGGCSNDVLVFRANDNIDSTFLYYVLSDDSFFDHIMSSANGTKMPRGNRKLIPSFEINLPPLSTQHRIATILSRYDSLIENYQKQIKLLEEAAQRLYKEWFIDLHFPGHENTNIIDGVPEGWEKKTIDDVTCKITTGLNPRKNFVLGKGSNYYVTIKNMADNTLFLDDRCDRVDNEALEKINKRSDLKIGDILFSGIGTIGRVALVYIPTNNWNVSESVFTLRANDIVTKEFLYLMLLSPDMQNYCQSNAHGAAQKGIRMADLKAYSFNLPPFGVIQKFTNLVTPTIKKVSSIRNQIRLLTEARDRLLPKLMSGEIAV